MYKPIFLLSLAAVSWFNFGLASDAQAAAPSRVNQPYAESKCNTDPNIIFCEDFNDPSNFSFVQTCGAGCGTAVWNNPGLTKTTFDFSYGTGGRQINPATDYPPKPSGAMPSGGQLDHVWVGNWDPTKGVQSNGATWGRLRESGGNYVNGTTPATDFYLRFQFYVTPNYAWPGDPKTDKYNYGAANPVDNKIVFIYPPEGTGNPTGASYDAGLYTNSSVWDPNNNARFSDAIAIRYGTAQDFQYLPMCPGCSNFPNYYEYAPFQSLILRNPNDSKLLGRVFRLNTGRWYTFELHYKLSSTNQPNGKIELWVDGSLIYSQNNVTTCGSAESGDCSGLGGIFVGAYHNGIDKTVWNGQQIIDNLIVSRAYIGPPGGGGGDTTPPAAPSGLIVLP